MNDTVPEPPETVNPAVLPARRDFLAMLYAHIEAQQHAYQAYRTASVGFPAIFCNVLENCHFLYLKSGTGFSGTPV
ncbi:hypothetical protein HKD24_05550 [Gluconobacter sp. LMG 31484]|uniref:Uncharacterized protein n=1 Tax=Gluconobacter vitians TaxID=2728102 RepID=A0ABR9Y409_9PROT|nr:hypothetical protein [Gluconobacter vitians]MBF0858681.1 hypothetical protein [Gluconobacter vitians]